METITGHKDTDRLVFLQLDDKDLLRSCQVNSYTNKLCDDSFFLNRILKKYPSWFNSNIYKQKWRKFYLNQLIYIDKLNKFGFTYSDKSLGSAEEYYDILNYDLSLGKINEAIEKSYIDLLEFMISERRVFKDDILSNAIRIKNEQLINYLLEKYQDFNANFLIFSALSSNNFKLVDYFVTKGLDLQERYNLWKRLTPIEMKNYIADKYNIDV